MSCRYCGTPDCPPCESSNFDQVIDSFWNGRIDKYPDRKSAIKGYFYYIHRIQRANLHLKSHLLNLGGRQMTLDSPDFADRE